MKSLLQNSKTLLAAFAVATAGLTAPALANDTNAPTANVETVAYAQQELASLSSQEALDQSNGRVLLHFGNNFIPAEVNAIVQVMRNEGINVDAYYGSSNESEVSVYFYGNEIPRRYSSADTDLMMITIKQLAEKYNLIASANQNSPDAG